MDKSKPDEFVQQVMIPYSAGLLLSIYITMDIKNIVKVLVIVYFKSC